MNDIAIHSLAEHVHAIPSIADWFYEEWREIYGHGCQAAVRTRIESWATEDRIPTGLVAVANGRVIGTVALKEQELQLQYSPWLAGLFVRSEFRGRGVGQMLVRAAEKTAAALGVQELFLYTPQSQAFYEGLGWRVLEYWELPVGRVTVMSKFL
jgi:N-acetylglutamate synthase-like GNAT family acetyltransferase